MTVRTYAARHQDEGPLPANAIIFSYDPQWSGQPRDGGLRQRPLAVPFDADRWRPSPTKMRRMIVTCATLSAGSRHFAALGEFARGLPMHRFVLVLGEAKSEATAQDVYVMISRDARTVEIERLSRGETVAEIVAAAKIYLALLDEEDGTEATLRAYSDMLQAKATGSRVLVDCSRSGTPYAVAGAERSFQARDEAIAAIRSICAEDETTDRRLWREATDYAFQVHSDEFVLRPVYEAWLAAYGERGKAAAGTKMLAEQEPAA